MEIQTKQQKRAAFALGEIEELRRGNSVNADVATFIVGTPNMILSNGLGQTLAFLLSKESDKDKQEEKDKKYKYVFDILKRYICQENSSQFGNADENNFEFLKKFYSVSQSDYLTMQQECLRMLEWLKRYARAFSEKKEK